MPVCNTVVDSTDRPKRAVSGLRAWLVSVGLGAVIVVVPWQEVGVSVIFRR